MKPIAFRIRVCIVALLSLGGASAQDWDQQAVADARQDRTFIRHRAIYVRAKLPPISP